LFIIHYATTRDIMFLPLARTFASTFNGIILLQSAYFNLNAKTEDYILFYYMYIIIFLSYVDYILLYKTLYEKLCVCTYIDL